MDTKHALKGTIYVKFDNPSTGKEAKRTSKYSDSVPIKAFTGSFPVPGRSNNVIVERTMFPGKLAWGITNHKSQGSTYEFMKGTMKTVTKRNVCPGEMYTMFSRVKTLAGLNITDFDKEKIIVNEKALTEMNRLREGRQLSYKYPIDCLSPNKYLSIAHLNIRSLKSHYEDRCAHHITPHIDILCLTETHLKDYSSKTICNMKSFSSCPEQDMQHGCVIYTSKKVRHTFSFVSRIEIVGVIVETNMILCVYVPPNTPWGFQQTFFEEMLSDLQILKNNYACNCLFITGDFNTNNSSSYNNITNLFNTRLGLKEVINSPTHFLGHNLDLMFTDYTDFETVNHPVYFTDHNYIAAYLYRNK